MLHQADEARDLSLPDDGSIPDFMKVENRPAIFRQPPQQELKPMRDDETAAPAAETETPAPAPAKPAPAKPAKAKATKKAAATNGKGNGKAAVKTAAKATKTAAGKAAKPAKGKVAKKAERTRDPAKLDQWGFRKDSIKSRAAAIYAKGKGATLAEVKEAVGSVQFNLLTELEENGFTVDKDEVKGPTGRLVTRYKLRPKEA